MLSHARNATTIARLPALAICLLVGAAGTNALAERQCHPTAAHEGQPAPLELSAEIEARCVELLRQGLKSDEFWPSMHAAEALTLAGYGEEVRTALEPRLATETDDQHRCGLAREIVRAGGLSRVNMLLEVLAGEDAYGHVHAAESLYKVGQIGDGRLLRAAMAREESPPLQLMAAAALGRRGNPGAMQLIRRKLADEDLDVSRIAAWVLARLGDASDVGPLRENLPRMKTPLARCFFECALAALGDAAGREALVRNLGAEDPAVRTFAATFAGELGMRATADRLVEMLDDPALDARIRAAQSLLVLARPKRPGAAKTPPAMSAEPAPASRTQSAEPDAIALRRRNLLVSPGFEADAGWQLRGDGAAVDATVARSGHRSLRLSNRSVEETSSAFQAITFDTPIRHPIRVAGWSRAEGVEVERDYDVFLDLEYADGTPLWGKITRFQPGTHDWQPSELIFDVDKPVKRIQVFVFLRKGKGTVWFDDLEVGLAPFAFRSLRVMPDLFGRGSLGVAAGTTLPAAWRATLTGATGPLAHAEGDRMPLRLDWINPRPTPCAKCSLRLVATDELLGETIEHTEELEIGPGTVGPGYAVWTESSMRRVMPSDVPPAEDDNRLSAGRLSSDRPAKAPGGPTANRPQAAINLAGGEYESFQVAILPPRGQTLRDVRIEPSDLVSNGSGARIPARAIEWHQVGYVRVEKLRPHPAADPQATPGWWPEVLLPVERFDVAPGFTQSIWVTVHAPADTPAGEYSGKLTIRPAGSAPAHVAIRATVYDFSLPVRGHMKTAFALMDGFLEKIYGRPLNATLRQEYGNFVLRHRLNPDDISRTSPPAIKDLLHYRDAGLNAFNVLNMVEPRGERAWVCWSPPSVYTPEFKRRLIERLDPYVQQLRQNNLADRAYVYTFDERGEDFYPIIREYLGMVKQRYPEIATLTTAKIPQDPAVMRDLNVDWNCPLTRAYDFDRAEQCRAAGRQVWAYVCLGPGYPYANWLVDHPLIEGRVIWWQAYQQKMDGMLYWGLNIWSRANNDRPIDPERGPLLDWSITTGGKHDWLHGDGVLLYPGKNGPLGSIRLANLRDGLEDYEYLHLLAEKAGGIDAAREACLPVAASLTEFTRDPRVLAAQRHRIAQRILEAGQKPATGPRQSRPGRKAGDE